MDEKINLKDFRPIFSFGDNICDYYLIDKHGNIFSTYYGIFLKQIVTENGYKAVSLNCTDGKRIQRKVHRLLMMTFCYFPGCENFEVNHKDGNKFNNEISNLEWATSKENIHHAIDNGLRKSWSGDNNPNSKITEYEAFCIYNMVISGLSNEDIIYNIPNCNDSIITQIILGRTWNSIFTDEMISKMKNIRYPEILTDIDKHKICQYYQNIKSPVKFYGSTKQYVENCLYNLNIPVNDSTYRMAKRLLYKYQDPEITSLYNY